MNNLRVIPVLGSDLVKVSCLEVVERLGDQWKQLSGATVLITGGAGFLGRWFLTTLALVNEHVLSYRPCHIVCLDHFSRGRPKWLDALPGTETIMADISAIEFGSLPRFEYVVHGASIASPLFYRRAPLATMDANVRGIRALLEACVARIGAVRSVLFMSTSEIYGDPPAHEVPTSEAYNGNVSCTGPRACYDESKRYGETLCTTFHRVHGIPVKIARPFNNYGPGFVLEDGRVIPDLMRSVLSGQDIVLHSDGAPTRTFCYGADAVTGYFQLLFSDRNGEPYNIGAARPEISMGDLARLVADLAATELGRTVRIAHEASDDLHYLTHNPQRRCPDITKARNDIGFSPRWTLEAGLLATLRWHLQEVR